MNDEDLVKNYVELWKQTIAVQQHFNDIAWRIRQLALTALTFALGAAAVAAKDRTTIQLGGLEIQLSTTILIFGIIVWGSFYFVDQVWYHKLLIGAVKHGETLERALALYLPESGLTQEISKASPSHIKIGLGRFTPTKRITLHSTNKLRIFYAAGGIAQLVVAIILQFSSKTPHVYPL
ncbi:hypothetical protein LWP59_38945 [Amycolatopsis acidiphila]|uniref:Uncharacterized protein n=1 Tax=Amycolatopsis acidiphila TaxID=715473 RepID=A0A558AGQ5_9PSEU|nr:hypothetical protein [Amycolatopsis acidiphila]TVT23442.1 hypothetical protein FNH06_09575 [Amycolatopsis acidiphila]UIJ59892.1 hypothetical protein LWP59_38945 [Amycolatopsis acidiphila]GHG62602.1 hypothetical protein GCM10017788_18300 [Amycolatopsis acidiphila]